MPRHPNALPFGVLAIAALCGAVGCTALGSMFGVPTGDSTGCSPQVPAAYRIQTEVPVGTLEVQVTDASGAPRASASVLASRLVYTGARCPSIIEGTSDAQGWVRFERMKTGPYDVRLGDDSATASTEVVADRTARVTLQQP